MSDHMMQGMQLPMMLLWVIIAAAAAMLAAAAVYLARPAPHRPVARGRTQRQLWQSDCSSPNRTGHDIVV